MDYDVEMSELAPALGDWYRALMHLVAARADLAAVELFVARFRASEALPDFGERPPDEQDVVAARAELRGQASAQKLRADFMGEGYAGAIRRLRMAEQAVEAGWESVVDVCRGEPALLVKLKHWKEFMLT